MNDNLKMGISFALKFAAVATLAAAAFFSPLPERVAIVGAGVSYAAGHWFSKLSEI